MRGIIRPFRSLNVNGKSFRQVRMTTVDDKGRRFEKAKMLGGN